jgi:hypothetical protein
MRILTVLVLAGATLATLPASAQTIAGYGRWDVVAGLAPDDGSPFCAMTSQTADGRAFHVVWMERDRDLRLRIRDRRWRIRPGDQIPVRVEIDGVHAWTAHARPIHAQLIEILIANRDIPAWERAWRRGMRMEILFPGSAEPTWRLGLDGTNRATDAFVRCIDQAQARRPFGPTAVPDPFPDRGPGKIF